MDETIPPTHIVQVSTDNTESEYVYDSTVSTPLEDSESITCLLVTNANTGQQQLLQIPSGTVTSNQNMLLVVNSDTQNDNVVYNETLEDNQPEPFEETCSDVTRDEEAKIDDIIADKDVIIENSDHNNEWYNSVFCRKCVELFSSPVQLQEHNLSKHRNLFTCGVCFYGFKTSRLLRQHIVTHNEKQFFCKLCNEAFSRRETLDKHMKHYHSNVQICHLCHNLKEPQHVCFSCKHCKSKFKSRKSYEDHKCSETKLYHCPYCEMTFTRHTGLMNHMLNQENKRKFLCAECKSMFNTKGQLRRHERTHDPNTWLKCDKCGRKYATASGFRLHNIRKHDGHMPSGTNRQPLDTKKYRTRKHPAFKEQSVQTGHKCKSQTKSCQTTISPLSPPQETEVVFRTSPLSPSPESSTCVSPLPGFDRVSLTDTTDTALDEVSKILECDEDVIIDNDSYGFTEHSTVEILDQGTVKLPDVIGTESDNELY